MRKLLLRIALYLNRDNLKIFTRYLFTIKVAETNYPKLKTGQSLGMLEIDTRPNIVKFTDLINVEDEDEDYFLYYLSRYLEYISKWISEGHISIGYLFTNSGKKIERIKVLRKDSKKLLNDYTLNEMYGEKEVTISPREYGKDFTFHILDKDDNGDYFRDENGNYTGQGFFVHFMIEVDDYYFEWSHHKTLYNLGTIFKKHMGVEEISTDFRVMDNRISKEEE